MKKAQFNFDTALLVSDDFTHLNDLLSVFNSVFVISNTHPGVRAKNLIYRNIKSSLELLPVISVFILQEQYNSLISNYTPILVKSKPAMVIWNSDKLDKEKIKPLLNYGYKRISKEHEYHFWKVNK